MDIHGLQKMTLLDYPEHVAATVFLGGCDFRCPFCHNYELVDGSFSPIMTEDDLFSFLQKRVGILDGVAITGGEPCIRQGLITFIKKIRSLGFAIKLDTNGNHPEVLDRILTEDLADYVAMDIKNSPSKYASTIGLDHFDTKNIDKSVSMLLSSSIDYEFRTTVVKQFHEDSDFLQIGEWLSGAKNYYLQQFTSRNTVPDSTLSSPSADEMGRFLNIVSPHVEHAAIRGMS